MNLDLGDTKLIIAECEAQKATIEQAAYILATARWETAHTMKPVRETLAATSEDAVARLEKAWRTGRLPWVKTPYWRPDASGRSWHGRGYVQLTWEKNYISAGKRLGMDLVSNPDVVMQPEIAMKILVRGSLQGWFTGMKLSDYINDAKVDYRNARRVINGVDKAHEIAALAVSYEGTLEKAQYGAKPAKPDIIAAIVAFLKGLFARF